MRTLIEGALSGDLGILPKPSGKGVHALMKEYNISYPDSGSDER
jgi:hypothetical protein